MSEGLLTRYIEAGFPHFRQITGLPEWLVPDVVELAREMGDEGMLELATPLGLADQARSFLVQAPEADTVSIEVWQQAIGKWQATDQALPVSLALLRIWERVRYLQRRCELKVDATSFIRGLAVLSYVPFALNGDEILKKLAGILGGKAEEPAMLVDLYMMAVTNGEDNTLIGIEQLIRENRAWAAWSEKFLETGKAFPFIPRVIGVSPPLSGGLIQVLVTMIKEALDADTSGNNTN